MIICKFGGSSISNANNIKQVAEIIKSKKSNQIGLIFSAIGKTTNQLIEIGILASNSNETYHNKLDNLINLHNDIIKELDLIEQEFLQKIDDIYTRIRNLCLGIFYLEELSLKINDNLIAMGEILSAQIIYHYFIKNLLIKKKIKFIDSLNVFSTDSFFGKANINHISTQKNVNLNFQNLDFDIFIASGFISKNSRGEITTMGRGGGDYSAALYGSYLGVSRVEIWTDVDGIMTADPRIIPNTKLIKNITYDEIMELSHYGANVIYTPTIIPLYKSKIPIKIKNTFNPENDGTTIGFENTDNKYLATGLSTLNDICLIKVYGDYLIGRIGFSQNLFNCLAKNNINIIMISQSSCEYSIYLVIKKTDVDETNDKLKNEYLSEIVNHNLKIDFYNDKSVLAIETYNYQNIPKLMLKIYQIFVNLEIIIYTQTTSNHNICLVIDQKYLVLILKSIHQIIFEIEE